MTLHAPPGFTIEWVDALAVRPIRMEVLRKDAPIDKVVYPKDDSKPPSGTVHLGGRPDDKPWLVSVASFYIESVPDRVEVNRCGINAGAPGVRIRGMATLPYFRGRGLGRALVERAG